MEPNPKKSSTFGELLRQHHGPTPHELPGPLRELLEQLEHPATPSYEPTMNKFPPVPPAQRSHKGLGSAPDAHAAHPPGVPENVGEQDRQGSTTNPGYQQDR
jgi:hypothetical protein